MSFRNPVGPQPASVYWRRRILVLLGLIAVIAVIVLIVVRPGANAAPADPSPSPRPTEAAESSPPVATPAPPDAADPNAVADCAPGSVQVTAVTDKTTYAPEELPQLSFTIANSGAAPCNLNVGTSAQTFTITSGSDTIWTSTDCQSGPVDQVVALAPGTPVPSSPLPWERQRSSTDTCDQPDRPQVGAGGASYHLTVTVGGFTSEPAQFILN